LEKKVEAYIKRGSVAWIGPMLRVGEVTHRNMDHKEGNYFGLEHPDDETAGVPLVSLLEPSRGNLR